jgi:hypothetical protein
MIPPGWTRPRWQLALGFTYLVGSEGAPSDWIYVPNGFEFDGASVPIPFRGILPMAHSSYLQAAALHDWMIGNPSYSDAYADRVFLEALLVLDMPRPWAWAMYAAVRLGSLIRALKSKDHTHAH